MNDWLFDLGNTRFKSAPWQADGGIGPVVAQPHENEPGSTHPNLSSLPTGMTAWLASVATPQRTQAIVAQLNTHFTQVIVARTLPAMAGVRIAYRDPGKLGVDRFLAMLAAHRERQPTVIASVGTALTLDVLASSGHHRGGRIAASPTTMRQALHARAAQLPETGGTYHEFANDTADSLVSGCEGAAIALIERTCTQAAQTLGSPPLLLIHGGGAECLLPALPDAIFRPKLVLEGLAVWAATTRESANP